MLTPNNLEAGPVRPSVEMPATWGIFRGSARRSLGTGLAYLVVFEASVLGSGQILHLGHLSVKMLLFALCMLYILIAQFAGDRMQVSTTLLLVAYLVSMILAISIGLLNGAELDRIGEDISPLLSFLLLPFFELTIRTPKNIAMVIRAIMVASAVITCAYLCITVGLWTGHLTYAALMVWLEPLGNGDFMFDASTGRVFYKGAIYLCIALIFFLFQRGRWAKVAALLMVLNLIAIGTRGFFLALSLTGLLYLLIGRIRTIRKVALFLPLVLAAALLLPKLFLLAGDRSDSNRERIVTINQAFEHTNILTTIVGNGFGIGVPERPEHMEISYLEILYKQGIVGLCWWSALLVMLVLRFRRAIRWADPRRSYPFFLSSIFIAIESFTNPFINNPIGMTFVTVSLACLNVYGSNDAHGCEFPHPGRG
jgi:hypothetical protein